MQKTIPINESYYKYLIILSALLAYAGSYSVGWYFDGMPVRQMFYEIDGIVPLKNFLSVTGASYIGYVGWLSFYLNQYLPGNHVWEYHLVNVFIHAANALLVYLIIVNIFLTPYFKKKEGTEYASYHVYALSAGLLFAVHPITTQSVTYLYQRFTCLATLFYLSSFYLYTLFRLKKNESRISKGRLMIFYLLSFFLANLGLYTKHHLVTLPLILVLVEIYFFSIQGIKRKEKLKNILIYISPFFFAVFVRFIWFDHYLTSFHTTASETIIVKNPNAASFFYIPRSTYLLTEFRVIITYLRLLLFPTNQTVLYDYPYAVSPFELPIIISFFLLCAGFLVALKIFNTWRIISFFILWFFVNIAVTSSIIPERQVIFEHRLYLPGIGIIVAVSLIILPMYTKLQNTRVKNNNKQLIFLVCIILVIFFHSVNLIKRNRIWSDETILIEDMVKKAPNNVLAISQLGFIYFQESKIEKGEELLLKALDLHPAFKVTLLGLCGFYINERRFDDAHEILTNAIRFSPDALYIIEQLRYIEFLQNKKKDDKKL